MIFCEERKKNWLADKFDWEKDVVIYSIGKAWFKRNL